MIGKRSGQRLCGNAQFAQHHIWNPFRIHYGDEGEMCNDNIYNKKITHNEKMSNKI
jgi:hypothetical protein